MTLADRIRDLAGIDGTIPSTTHKVVDVFESDYPILKRNGSKIEVGYLVHDDSPAAFWDDDDGNGDYLNLSRGDDPNQMMEDLESEGKIAFFVERYSHGLVHYSVANTGNYPDRKWDVGVAGILVPCQDVQDLYKTTLSEKGEEAARSAVIKDCNNVLQSFSDWSNGFVYGVVVETWEIEGEHVRAVSEDSVWGLIGSSHAFDELKDMMADTDPSKSPEV